MLRRPADSARYPGCNFGKTLRSSGVLASMGLVGSAYHDAMVELFFATPKEKLVYQRAWPTRHEPDMGSSATSRASRTRGVGTAAGTTSTRRPTRRSSRSR
ncbi:protein of unknown function [Blastococcus saxobsidens DD2]|uniref:Transposase n=1 Tax=Blastococcus saxobsidens (strain DD2) TaxID=1146883 RepID=H6RQ44_BLASD|nr:protein of unknown function [Blastococcus saxobsidens DD2]